MMPISVVIITRNEAHIIGRTLQSIATLTDDIVIVDSGSCDETIAICKAFNANIIQTNWEGFGINKNKGITAAKHDWILSIDADEMPDDALKASILETGFSDELTGYTLRFKTFLGKKEIRFGEWANDAHLRVFNRRKVRWNDAAVHERLLLPPGFITQHLHGNILHYTMKDLAEYATKMNSYALLGAQRYFEQGKKSPWIKRNLSHRFSFVQNYFIRLGFLDGIHGYWIARMTAQYTFLKYARLYELIKNSAS